MMALDPPQARQDRPLVRSTDAGRSQVSLVQTFSSCCMNLNPLCLSFPIKLTYSLIVWLKEVNIR